MPNRIARLLRQQAEAAREEELRRALQPLAHAFRDWEHGRLPSSSVSQLMERVRDGAVRDVDLRYGNDQLSMAVAYAIASGVLPKETVPPELLQHLQGAIEFYASEPLTAAS
jgi:hypothetical protein